MINLCHLLLYGLLELLDYTVNLLMEGICSDIGILEFYNILINKNNVKGRDCIFLIMSLDKFPGSHQEILAYVL